MSPKVIELRKGGRQRVLVAHQRADVRHALRTLIDRSISLQNQVRRIDATMHNRDVEPTLVPNPVEHQLGLLKAAFGAE